MRWVRTRNGDRAHAVSNRRDGFTLCGIELRHAVAIVTPGVEDRCENCDHEWRKKAKKTGVNKRRPKTVYVNRFTFRDWEEL